jgi:uncharacterized protein (DUF849 family)
MKKTIVTCAVTGNITTLAQHPGLPVTPEQIAEASLQAAEAGAAIIHIHVRDPATGRGSMELSLYQDVVERIRLKNTAVILNLTTGPGGRFVPGKENPRIGGEGSTLTTPEMRTQHVPVLKPEICTLDLNTMNSGAEVVINTPSSVSRMAEIILASGTLPEIELFDSGDLQLALDLMRKGLLPTPGMFSLVLGVKYGFPATSETMLYARSMLPPGAVWTGFGIGRNSFGMVAQSFLLGGHVRVGLEDNVYLAKGLLAPDNAALVTKAVQIITALGGEIASCAEAREIVGIESPLPVQRAVA